MILQLAENTRHGWKRWHFSLTGWLDSTLREAPLTGAPALSIPWRDKALTSALLLRFRFAAVRKNARGAKKRGHSVGSPRTMGLRAASTLTNLRFLIKLSLRFFLRVPPAAGRSYNWQYIRLWI
jgi:hypothetical protein